VAVPTVVGVGTVGKIAAGTIAPGLPIGWAADDIHVLPMESQLQPVTLISGWNLTGAGSIPQPGGNVTTLTVWWHRAVAGDAAPVITSPGDHLIGQILGVRGCPATGDPWDFTSFAIESVADTSIATPAGATTVADCLAIGAVATGADSNTAQISGSAWANTSLANISSGVNQWTILGGGGGIGAATGEKAAAGAVNAFTATLVTANFKALFTGALRPAGGGGAAAGRGKLRRIPVRARPGRSRRAIFT
jgi:hypothetical protein